MMRYVLWPLLGLFGLALLALLLLGRKRGITGGRAGRLARMARLWARLSASWMGARVRRWFASAEGRRRIDAAGRRAAAERVAREMGQMKGALMKLGQMLSFITDAVPEEFRSALSQLQAQAPPMEFP